MTPSMADILMVVSLAVILLWTVRLARFKGLNPWVWGVGSVLLMAVTWQYSRDFLGLVVMAPLVFLLLYKSPLFRRNSSQTQATCPRCAAPDPGGLNFCVNCGWELAKTYTEVTAGAETAEHAPMPTEIHREPEMEPTPGVPEMEVESPFKPTAETAEATEVQPAPEPASVQDTPSAQPVFASETESAAAKIVRDERAERTEPQKPTVRRFPTAVSLTERGIALFSQERFQESVDQFTKAIALDPSYKLALKHRAEAYGRLGRAEQEAADQRQLEAI